MSVATTYAEALYQAAEEAGAVDEVASQVAEFARAWRETPDLRNVLDNPEVDRRAKKAVVTALTEEAHPVVGNFLQVLVDRSRLSEFPEIARALEERVAQAEDRLEVEAITAVPLPEDLRRRIIERVQRTTGATVDLTESVDPSIVGGLVLRVGGIVVDGSVRHRLEELSQSMRGAPVDAAAVTS